MQRKTIYADKVSIMLGTLFILGFVAVHPAQALIFDMGVFTGNRQETWESFANYNVLGGFTTSPLPDPTTIMSGGATISNPNMLVYEPSAPCTPACAFFGLGSSGLAQVSDGDKGMGLNGVQKTATLVFTEPVRSFGAYWGADTLTLPCCPTVDPAIVSVNFFDASNTLIGSITFPYSRSTFDDGLLEWHGWTSTDMITKITYSGNFVAIDGLQATSVPEPTTLLLLGSGIAGLISFRRMGLLLREWVNLA